MLVNGPAAGAMLAAYDAQLRARIPDALPAGIRVVRDGPLVRFYGMPRRGFIVYRDLAGLEGDALDELIARQVEVYGGRGERFEWKLHGHDLPVDLPERLLKAGFVPDDEETIVIARVEDVVATPVLPAGVGLREVTARADLDRIEELEAAVWGTDHAGVAEMLERELAADPGSTAVVMVEAGEQVVCAAWEHFDRGTDFASLWGGATLAPWRGRGIYRATVAHRANLAAQRGYRYLQVDASDDSRPILERLGFVAVTTTTPYVWSPP